MVSIFSVEFSVALIHLMFTVLIFNKSIKMSDVILFRNVKILSRTCGIIM